ncbi:MAG: primosomal protein N' [Mariprofundaceae bacterium]
MMPADNQSVCVEVAVFCPLPGTFTYRWPVALGQPEAGIRVTVPFGKTSRKGVLVGVSEMGTRDGLKTVEDRLDIEPLYDALRTGWLERVRRFYLATTGEMWSAALACVAHDDMRRFRCGDIEALETAFPPLAGIFRTRAALSLKTMVQRAAGAGTVYAALSAARAGLLQEKDDPAQEPHGGADECVPGPALTADQREAVEAVGRQGKGFRPYLLFGRTGSGKTEVYLKLAEACSHAGGQVLVLVPEIGLTPMWLARLKQRFRHIRFWHSAMTARDRLAATGHLAALDVLVGTRSALFLPLPKLAMIIVDEEHDGSFKQQDGIAYSARDMAVLLAQQLDIPIILGSATPSLESWRQCREGRYTRLNLPHPIIRKASPVVPGIVDMRGVDAPVSPTLEKAIRQTLDQHGQVMLYLNRRGYAPALQCTACGDVPECPDCSLRLSLHRRAGQLRCHSCGHVRKAPMYCRQCGESALMPLGEGTEKLEEWLTEHIPTLRFARFDRDIMTSHRRLSETLAMFEKGEIDCLIGTQMLVKGHDYPNVTLVGVVNADLGISMPDFRAGERWWQQMTQVTGRAGRGEKPGQVIIQTRMPEAPWLSRLGEEDAEKILDEELALREQLHYPPYARWVRLVFSSTRAERAMQAAADFAALCRDERAGLENVAVSEPMACSIERVARRYRFEVLLRDSGRETLPWKLAPLLSAQKLPGNVRRRVDVDPQDMM